MNILTELKRRNVIRMAGSYLVGAWLLVQVAGTVLPMFGAPDWFRSKKVSPVELTRECLSRIERLNPKLNAFIAVTADSALAEASAAEPTALVTIYLGLGQKEKCWIGWKNLTRSRTAPKAFGVGILRLTSYDNVRNEPRFQAILKRIGLE